MDDIKYKFKTLESKYEGFLAPAFTITVGSTEIDSSKIPITSLSVDIDLGESAGGCSFVISSVYDYENSRWASDLLDTIEVGKKIVIEAGYVSKTRVFYGFVDDYTIEYSSDAAPCLTVSGIDAKGFLMNAKDNKYMSANSTEDVVEEILNECVSKGYAEKVRIGDIVDFAAQLIKDEIDDYKFLCFLAELYNMQFGVVNGEMIFDNLMSDTGILIILTLGVSLLSFSKKMSLDQQVGKVVIYGIDPLTLEPISGEATSTSISGEGSSAIGHASGYRDVVEEEENFFVRTSKECERLAQARFDKRAFSFLTGKGRCIGMPEIIPGWYIQIEGIDEESSDTYFITKVTHDYSSEEGYYTSFEVKGAKSK